MGKTNPSEASHAIGKTLTRRFHAILPGAGPNAQSSIFFFSNLSIRISNEFIDIL